MLNDCTCIINVTKFFWYKIFLNLKIKKVLFTLNEINFLKNVQ
jgi:hypothetical protein